MNVNKDRIQNSFLETIAGIADKDYQKRIWIMGEGPECDDFDETVNFFFDQGDPILEKYEEFGLSEGQYHLLVKFRDAFEAFSDKNDLPQKFINSSEWEKIVAMAKDVLRAFNYKEELL